MKATIGVQPKGTIVVWEGHHLIVRAPYPRGFEETVEVDVVGAPGHHYYIPRDTIIEVIPKKGPECHQRGENPKDGLCGGG